MKKFIPPLFIVISILTLTFLIGHFLEKEQYRWVAVSMLLKDWIFVGIFSSVTNLIYRQNKEQREQLVILHTGFETLRKENVPPRSLGNEFVGSVPSSFN